MEQQSVCTRFDRFGDSRQHIVRIDAESFRRLDLTCCELVTEPAEDDAAVIDRSTDHPMLVRQRITEDATFRIFDRFRDDRSDGAARPDGHGDDPLFEGTDPEVREHAVACPDDEGEVPAERLGHLRCHM